MNQYNDRVTMEGDRSIKADPACSTVLDTSCRLAQLHSVAARGTWAPTLRSPGSQWGWRTPLLPLHFSFKLGTSRLSPRENKAAFLQGSSMLSRISTERGNHFIWESLNCVLCQLYARDISFIHIAGWFLPFGVWGMNTTHFLWSHSK